MAETPLTPDSPADPIPAPAEALTAESPSPEPAPVAEPVVEAVVEALTPPEPAAEPQPEPAPTPAPEPASAPAPEPAAEPAPQAVIEPQPAPAPVTPPAPEPTPVASGEPAVAATLEVPPLPGGEAGEGGEFDLLVAKLQAWFEEADLAGQWQKLRGPLKGVALLVVVILALRLYARVVGALDSIPLISGLLELTGLVYLLWFGVTRLLRTDEREKVFADWQRRWQAFSGRD